MFNLEMNKASLLEEKTQASFYNNSPNPRKANVQTILKQQPYTSNRFRAACAERWGFVTITEQGSHARWVTVLINLSCARLSDPTTPTQPSSRAASPQCRVGCLTNVRQSISDQQEPKEGIRKTRALFLCFILSLLGPDLFSFHCDWCVINFSLDESSRERPRQPVGAISDLCLGHCFLLSTLKYLRIRPWVIKKSCFKSFTSLCGKTAGLLKCYWAAEDLFFVGLQKAPWQSEEMDNWANVIELTTKSRCNYDSGVISG